MDLSILFYMPLMIETMSPKWTMDRIRLVVSFTIGAFEQMRARFALFGFESWRDDFVVGFATPPEFSVVF